MPPISWRASTCRRTSIPSSARVLVSVGMGMVLHSPHLIPFPGSPYGDGQRHFHIRLMRMWEAAWALPSQRHSRPALSIPPVPSGGEHDAVRFGLLGHAQHPPPCPAKGDGYRPSQQEGGLIYNNW
jgi:hypothetical protein